MTLGDRSESFQLINDVSIFGGYAGFGEADPNARDIDLYETILSGDLNDDDIEVISSDDLAGYAGRVENSYQVVTGSGTDETAVLDGFTITGGNADVFTDCNGGGMLNEYGSPQIINCTFSENSAQYYGGGIYNYYGSPTLANCTFTRNSAGIDGGGIYDGYSNPIIADCIFIGNSSNSGADIYNFAATEGRAGGMDKDSRSRLILINCTFTANFAEDNGGAIYSFENNPNLTNCTFSKNLAGYGGGGLCFNNCDPNLTGCSISENSARYGGGMYNDSSILTLTYCTLVANSGYDYGGGMYNIGSSYLSLNNCIVTTNRANSYGGGMSNNNSDLALTNCTFTGNSARNGSAFAFNSRDQMEQSTAGLIDCILWNNSDEIWNNDSSKIAISYSNIRGGWLGTGNIDADPMFTDPNGPDNIPGTEDDDFSLAPLSSCIDAGDPSYAPGPDKKDLNDNPRIVNGRVDMGAYEYQGIIYVDNQAPGDPEQGDLLEDGSEGRNDI